MIVHKTYNFDKWYNKNINHSEMNIKNIINIIYNYLIDFIDSNIEIKINTDKETFYKNLCKFLYNEYFLYNKINYISNNKNYTDDYEENLDILFEYFNSIFSDEITDLYMNFKDITKYYNVDLFTNKNDTSFPFVEFLFYNCDIKESYLDDEDSDLEENHNYDFF
tara:strand:- start:216 stop:710 length:495 start_codon:yes stop_codon:yes gene_type:complete